MRPAPARRPPEGARAQAGCSAHAPTAGRPKAEIERAAHGVDPVQALVLALIAIGDRLPQQGQRLLLLGHTDLGFPVTDPPARDPITHLTATLRQPLLPPDVR